MTAEPNPPNRTLVARLIRPTLPELWTFLAIALPVIAALRAVLPTADLAFQLRAGAEILGGRGAFTTDSWTFTTFGLEWLNQQWGAQAVLAAVYATSGWTGLAVFRAVLVGAICGLILVAVRLRAPGMRSRTAALLTLAAFAVMSPALALRPQLLGMFFFAATLAILAARRNHRTWLWILPVVAVAWANAHGSFILAPVLVGLAWLEDLHEHEPGASRTLIAAIAAGAVTLVTPFGIGVWQYALSLAGNREIRTRVIEWQPPSIDDRTGALFLVSIVLIAIAVVALGRRRRGLPWPAVLGLVAFATLGMLAVRGVAWWPGFAVVTLAGLAVSSSSQDAARTTSRAPRGSRINSLIVSGLILMAVSFLPAWRPVDPGLNAPTDLLQAAPSRITAVLRQLATPADRVWNPQTWGSWLEFAVPAPAYALDSRIEFIPEDVWADNDLVTSATPGWQDILDRAGVTIVVSEGPLTLPLGWALEDDSSWKLLHADTAGAVWVRADR